MKNDEQNTGTEPIASAIKELDNWRVACNWQSTNPEWDATLKIVIAFASKSKQLERELNAANEKLTAYERDHATICYQCAAAMPNAPHEPRRE